MSITAKKVQYQSLKSDPQAIKSNYENNGCTASNQKNVTLKNREFMTFEVTCNNENTLVVYTKANDEFTYGVDIRNTDNITMKNSLKAFIFSHTFPRPTISHQYHYS